MEETKSFIGPFYIIDSYGNLVWKGNLKEFTFEDENGRRWCGKIEPAEKRPIPAKVRKKRGAGWKR